MQKRSLILIAIVLCVASLTATLTLLAYTRPSTTTLYVNPPVIEDPTILPGSTITIQIMTTTVANLKVCEFNVTYSPTVLSIQRVTKEQVQGRYPQMNMTFDDAEGYVWIKLTYDAPLTIVTNTSLIEIEFFVEGYGPSPLHFDSSQMLDGLGNPIPHDTADGFIRIFVRNIAVVEIIVPTDETYVGRIIPINVTVINDGDISESFDVQLFYDTTLIATQPVPNLPSKQNTTLTFDWDTGTVTPRLAPYVIKAEATILPNEINTTDNTLADGSVKMKIVGDVNGDGSVDIDDLNAWDAAYGSHFGDLNWNVQADINMDGVVNKTDGNIIVDHYKETV